MLKQIDKSKSSLPHNKDYYIDHSLISRGEHYAPHWHDYFEVEIVLSGNGEHIYNNTDCLLKRGSIYLMSYYDFHELSAKEDMQILKLQFNENVLPDSLNDFLALSHNRFCCTVDENELEHVIKLFDILTREERRGDLFSEMLIKNLIAEIVITVVRNSAPDESTVIPGIVQKAVAHIHNNFRKPLTLSSVAEHCNVTPNYLGARFSDKMGISFSDYLNTVRLRYACNLLDGTDLSIKEIAFASGYNSVNYFGYIFKKNLGTSPLNYKRGF